LTLITLSCVSLTALMSKFTGTASAQVVALPDLPPGLVVPAQLPASLTDPDVLVAWIKLYSHAEPIPLWDGRTLTGRELAQFLLGERIPVVWDVGGICGGHSCSVKHYSWFGWVFEGQAPGVDPIYLRPALQTDPHGLLMVLAHEIFHRTQPFGAVPDSQFEEYWSFRIGNAIAPAVWPVFDGYDPILSRGLLTWLRDNNIGAYASFPAFPPTFDGAIVSAGVARPQDLNAEAELRLEIQARLDALSAAPTSAAQEFGLPQWLALGQ